MVRAAAKNHANVAIVTSPDALRRRPRGARGRRASVRAGLRAALAVEAFRHTAAYDARIAEELPGADGRRRRRRCPTSRACPAPRDPYPADADDRAREGRDAPLRREPAPAGGALPAARARAPADGPFATGGAAAPGQGALATTTSSTRPPRRRSVGRCAVPAASSSSTRTRAARPSARRCSRPGRPRWPATRSRAFGGVVALTRPVDRTIAEALASIFLEVVVAPGLRRRGAGRSWPRSRTSACSWTRRSARRSGRGPPPTRLGVDPDGRRGGPGDRAGHGAGRPGDLDASPPAAAPTPTRSARPRPRLASRPGRDARTRSCSSATAGSIGLGLGPDEPRGRGPAGGREGAGHPRAGGARRCGLRVGRVLPVPRCGRGLPGGRRHRLRPARRLDPRRRGGRRRRRCRRDDAGHRDRHFRH